jgi:hypothetical protein
MLRNRKHEEALKLKGVNHVDEVTDLDLGDFSTLQNWIPADVYAIKKKRGVSPLNPFSLAVRITEAGDTRVTEDGETRITEA